MFLLKFYNKNFNKNNNIKINIIIKPKKQKTFTLLRAPFRHKLAKNQIGFFYYNFFLKLNLKKNNLIDTSTIKDFNVFFLKLIKFSNLFESNICFQKSIIIFCKLNIKKYWNYNIIKK